MDIRLTETMVEVFFHGSRVASHKRVLRPLRDPVVQPEHMPIKHRKYLTYNADEFIRWAQDTGQYTLAVVKAFLSSGREPEQGYKSCASLTRLGDKYGLDRLEKACERVIAYSVQPSIRNISTVLKNRQDKLASALSDVPKPPKSHGITRGAAYIQRGGVQQ